MEDRTCTTKDRVEMEKVLYTWVAEEMSSVAVATVWRCTLEDERETVGMVHKISHAASFESLMDLVAYMCKDGWEPTFELGVLE